MRSPALAHNGELEWVKGGGPTATMGALLPVVAPWKLLNRHTAE
jgi:hypothetical protein